MLVLPGVLAVAGYQNRDKLGAMLTPPRAPAPTRTKARLLTLGAKCSNGSLGLSIRPRPTAGSAPDRKNPCARRADRTLDADTITALLEKTTLNRSDL